MSNQTTTYRATFGDAVLSEWTKLRTLRSTTYTLLATCVLAVGLTALIASGSYDDLSAAERADFDPTATALKAFIVAQIAMAAFGVLAVTAEYSNGMIRTSLAAVPKRARLLSAKALVFAVVALVLGQVVAFTSFLVGTGVLAGTGAPTSAFGDPGVLRAVLGEGLYLALVGLLGVAAGVLVRATAGGILVMVVTTLLVPAFTPALPGPIADLMIQYWPTIAGTRIMSVVPDPAQPSPWVGLAVLCAWTVATLSAAFMVFRRRDA